MTDGESTRMKLLITGAGFIGRALRREFPLLNITFLSRTERPEPWIKGEVTDFRFPAPDFTHIIHAPLFEPAFYNREPEGFLRVKEFAVACGAKLLYVSSGAAATGTDDYAHWKRKTEALAGDDYIARLYSFIGPDLSPEKYAIMDFIYSALQTGHITVIGDGQNTRSWMWQGDMAKALLGIMENGDRGRHYEVGSFEPHTIMSGARAVARETGATITIEGNRQGNMEYLPVHIHMGARYRPLEESIRLTIGALQNNT